ncbi:MAG: hypothetical protein ABIK09_07400 [Pseudomonadota bacterium]
MHLLAARTLTLGFILAFTNLVTTPAPVLCSHDCGEIHVMGAAEHMGHEQPADHAEDAPDDGHGLQHRCGDDAHDDAQCVDVSIVIDTLLPPSRSADDHGAPVLATLAHVGTAAPSAGLVVSHPEGDPAPARAPLQHLGRLLI